jgi:hypothetical protein
MFAWIFSSARSSRALTRSLSKRVISTVNVAGGRMAAFTRSRVDFATWAHYALSTPCRILSTGDFALAMILYTVSSPRIGENAPS